MTPEDPRRRGEASERRCGQQKDEGQSRCAQKSAPSDGGVCATTMIRPRRLYGSINWAATFSVACGEEPRNECLPLRERMEKYVSDAAVLRTSARTSANLQRIGPRSTTNAAAVEGVQRECRMPRLNSLSNSAWHAKRLDAVPESSLL